ncbi:hypothetical protein [Teredinibacter purpureus]|jgi:hypothetical protein|uniref:hypothetical protein n=1 Tax=Teredinibacter purpureus TaxID=2731756 RepID=UPI0005F80063|nr:hypothetical protein [Teredinibacter purpureus]
MKPLKTKAQLRQELNDQINQFLATGGEVENVASGQSGNTDNTHLFSNSASFPPKQERTPVTEVIKQVDARRHNGTHSPLNRTRRPHKKLITDDFGEPLRWVWVD